jgi:hypothetical protein
MSPHFPRFLNPNRVSITSFSEFSGADGFQIAGVNPGR